MSPTISASPRQTINRPGQHVLAYSDVDDTIIDWERYNEGKDQAKLDRTLDTFQSHSDEVMLMPSTSRGITEMQRLASDFEGVELRALGLNNGQRLFVNTEELPAEEFIKGLSPEKEDPTWKGVVRDKYDWDLNLVMSELNGLVKKEGFKPAPRFEAPLETLVNFHKNIETPEGPQGITLSFYPDQASFAIRSDAGVPGEHHKAEGDKMMDQLLGKLKKQGLEIDHKSFLYQNEQFLFLMAPKGLDKAELLEHMTDRLPEMDKLVTFGDAENDTMLFRDEYGGLKNNRVLSGDRQSMVEKLEGQDRVIQVDEGELSQGLEYFLA